ncbi:MULTISPECIES: hypothetical protein [Falsihalocynthiibacter]|uniref:hypothetical protein n=1 Tax=Falsihalocynthiibacter TaxID=2854182 RepID=UPI00300148FD
MTLDNGKRVTKWTKTDDFEDAKEFAIKLNYETHARIENQLPAQTRKFKPVADFVIKRMNNVLNQSGGKIPYN